MDRHQLRLGIRQMDWPAAAGSCLGGRALAASPRRMGLGCGSLEVIPEVRRRRSEIVRGDLCFKVAFLWHAWNNPSCGLTGDETHAAIRRPGTAVPVNGLLFSFRHGGLAGLVVA